MRVADAETYFVTDDDGEHLVTIAGSHAHCTCKKRRPCLHIHGAAVMRCREARPGDGFAAFLRKPFAALRGSSDGLAVQ